MPISHHDLRLLPVVLDWPAYERIRFDSAAFLPAIEHIAARHGLTGLPQRFSTGTAVVFSVGEWVVKLFPPLFADDAQKEIFLLKAIDGRLGIPTPSVRGAGELEDYQYLIMRRLDGAPLDELWPELDATRRERLARKLGEVVRAFHAIEVTQEASLTVDWPKLRRDLRARAPAHHAEGLHASWFSELTHTLVLLDGEPEPDRERVLLHTELGPGHVLSDGERITGLSDVAEAMLGDPEYDFAAVGLLITQGDNTAFRAFLDGYGVASDARGVALEKRLLRHALLHKYGKLSWYLERVPPPDATLLGAAHFWFGHEP